MMREVRDNRRRGSVLIGAVILTFVITLMGITYLSIAFSITELVTDQIGSAQAYYDGISGAAQGLCDIIAGRSNFTGEKSFYTGNYIDYSLIPAGIISAEYGVSQNNRILGKGRSRYGGSEYKREIILNARDALSFADFLYISHRERDSLRHVVISFWTPDTIDGLVHSNDTIHISPSQPYPVFRRRVTTSSNQILPNDTTIFLEGWGYRPPIIFPDNIDNITSYSGYDWGTQGEDSLTQIVLSGNIVRMRKCGLRRINNADSICCYPATIESAPAYNIPNSGVIAVNGKVWVSASRGSVDIMDGEVPQRSRFDGGFISEGFAGRLTIAATDTIIITDNLIYRDSRADNSIPSTLDSCSDILGLVSPRYIMIGKDVNSTVYINAAMAAIGGSFSVQDIYMNHSPGWDNEKQSLMVYGSIAQRNRGIMHTTDYPPGHIRGFIEKDYHYDVRLTKQKPPHFPMIDEGNGVFFEDVSDYRKK